MIDADLKEFESRYRALISPSNTQFRSVTPSQRNRASSTSPFYSSPPNIERGIDIAMPESEFDKLVSLSALFRDVVNTGRDPTELGAIWYQNKKEERARHNNKAVQEAYDHYQMLINLTS